MDFQTGWAHVSNQEHQVSPRGASDWWRESVRKSVSVHQDKIRRSAIAPKVGIKFESDSTKSEMVRHGRYQCDQIDAAGGVHTTAADELRFST